ncbi:Cyclin-like protein [Pseudocohnilembus persalinus]|uniref:Cyclin-like protein n=1 Tax=Pseudocohnilembus persalinus TaxID=266149 RepID=A0A0V0R3Q6_PSEPJ|nr:Cyclin-like protein [Pseudocohnilembus persalinus]|eukprot:KRX09122.1 Cyclin-like protein [Pseudocohnilembus persalinus]
MQIIINQKKNINNKNQQQYQKKQLTLEEFSHYLDQKQSQDPQQVTEYSHQIIKYLQSIESNYLPAQYLVNVIRASIVDWVIEVSDFFKLKCETIHIAINIYDRFIAQRKDIKTLDQPIHQIIGGTALFMAAKYEEIYPPSLGDFARRMNFKKQDMVNIEGKIISKIGFTLTSPTSLKFMEAYSQFQALSEQQNNLARFLLQLGLHDPQLYNQKPSLIASASILTVKKMKNMELTNFWEEDMIQLTGYQQSELENVANVLFNLLLQIQNSQGSAVYIKFNTAQFQNVSQCIQANFQE